MLRYWTYFALLLTSWVSASTYVTDNKIALFYTILFFTGYHIIALVPMKIKQFLFVVMLSLVTLMFHSSTINPFVWLIYLLLTVQFREIFKQPIILYALILIHYSLYLSLNHSEVSLTSWVYQCLLVGISLILIEQFRKDRERLNQTETTLSAMKRDYNLLKRNIQQQESTIRQEERNQIARELHDAVGHRLTALLMQLEVARIQSKDDENTERLEGFKKLAQLSLQDTRKAVSTLQSDEQSGLQAVIYLIRKLESESHLRLSITLNAGVLNQHLTNTQSVVLYRALQEALTNMMKHSHTRQAKIIFEIVAQRELRFKICHKINNAITIKEGFGLKNMRERIETINGKLEYEVNNDSFELTGQFPVEVIQYD